MARPADEESDLQILNQIGLKQLRPKFQHDVGILRSKILGNTRPKVLFGKRLTGENLMIAVTEYVNSLNTGSFLNVEAAWT